MSGHDIEPLAYRVRPLREESFGSWLQRISAKHEATPQQLFAHLGVPRAWAGRDLTAWGSLQPYQRAQLADRLAFATQTTSARIERTLVKCRSLHLLPPTLRTFGCPRCWLEWLEAGEPWRIERRWILRVTLRCKRHALVLTDLRDIIVLGRTSASKRKLQERIVATRTLMDQVALMPTRLVDNDRIGHGQIEGRGPFSSETTEFWGALIGNKFHFSSARPVLLARLHTREEAVPARYAQLFDFDAAPRRVNAGPTRSGFNAAPRRVSARRTQSEKIPVLYDLVAANAALLLPKIDQLRAKLDLVALRLSLAWRVYPEVYAFHAQRPRRQALRQSLREGYAAELAETGATPVSALRGLQNALFLLKQSGMADDIVFFDPAAPDPWSEVLDDQQRLRARLAARFAHPMFERIVGRPPQLSTLERFNRSRS